MLVDTNIEKCYDSDMTFLQDYMRPELMLGLGLSLVAGLSTGIGAAVAFFMKRTSTRVLTFSLGASAGVMVYISFMELMPSAAEMLDGAAAKWIPLAAFFGGMAITCIIDRLVPESENPHEIHEFDEWKSTTDEDMLALREKKTKRSAMLFALAIALHNFPEGIATVAAAFDSPEVAFSVALAVAIHNIPEGVAVAIPLYCATGQRWKSFGLASLTGLAEPLGALVAMLILMPFLSPELIAVLFAGVSGIMVYISLDELLPMSRQWGHHHMAMYGLMGGMLLMGVLL